MGSLRDKLERLGHPRAARRPGPPAAAGPDERPADDEGPETGTVSAGDAGGLDQLRQRLARCLGSERAGARAGEADARVLPPEFVTEPTPVGSLHVRPARWALDTPVGAVELGSAARADMGVLALLGLCPALGRASLARALFVDVETTGLSGTGAVAFLVGLAWFESTPAAAWRFEQLFLGALGEEAPLLERVAARLEAAEVWVSYNGKAFDLPLLRARLVMNRRPPVAERPHLDLLHVVRRVHRHRPWRKTLAAAERHVLQHDRGADVAGAEVAQRYLHYLRTGDASALGEVFDHNRRDVASLVALSGWYGAPLAGLEAEELASVARLAQRVGRLAEAKELADRAVARGRCAPALRARAAIAKALGDKEQALADFEALAQEVDDPIVRLELAKLYEHYRRSPPAALRLLARGTGESEAASARRRARLERKLRARPSRRGS